MRSCSHFSLPARDALMPPARITIQYCAWRCVITFPARDFMAPAGKRASVLGTGHDSCGRVGVHDAGDSRRLPVDPRPATSQNLSCGGTTVQRMRTGRSSGRPCSETYTGGCTSGRKIKVWRRRCGAHSEEFLGRSVCHHNIIDAAGPSVIIIRGLKISVAG